MFFFLLNLPLRTKISPLKTRSRVVFFPLNLNLILVLESREQKEQNSLFSFLCFFLHLKRHKRRPIWIWPCMGFFFFFFFTVRVNYIRTVICHEPTQLGVAASIRVCVCALRGFPASCCLAMAARWPASACSINGRREEAARAVPHPHMNGRVGEFPLWLARSRRAHVCSQAPLRWLLRQDTGSAAKRAVCSCVSVGPHRQKHGDIRSVGTTLISTCLVTGREHLFADFKLLWDHFSGFRSC